MDNRARSSALNSFAVFLPRAFAMTFRRPLVLLVCLAAVSPIVAATVARSSEDPVPEPQVGVLGFQPPELGDVRLTDTLLNQDTIGGVAQQLLGASGSPGGGFGLVWRDQRDGTLGIYCARLDADANPREPERTVSANPSTTRRFDPAVAVAADGSGAVAWVGRQPQLGQRAWLRCFDAQGKWYGSDLVIPPVAAGPGQGRAGAGRDPAARDAGARDAGARGAGTGARTPVLLARRDGSRTLLWIEDGRVRCADFDIAGSPLRETVELGPAGTEPEITFFAVEDAQGGVAALWNGKGGVWFARRGAPGAKSTDAQLGAGRARGLAVTSDGSMWSLIQRGDAAVLRRLNAEGRPQGVEIAHPIVDLRDLGLAAHAGGLAILATRGEAPPPPSRGPGRGRIVGPGAGSGAGPEPQGPGARGAAPRADADAQSTTPSRLDLYFTDAAGALVAGDPLPVTSADARNVDRAYVASNGTKLLVAWDDDRLGDSDVWGRTVDPKLEGPARLGPEKRLNTDYASSDQIHADVDAVGERGWTVWQDRRAGPGSIYARPFGASGPSGEEILLPRPQGEAPATALDGGSVDPALAIRPDGSFLVVWIQRDESRARVLAQVLDKNGAAQSPALELDERRPATIERAVVTALGGDRGWFVAWPAGGKLGVHGRRVAPNGALAGPVRRLSDPGDDETMHADVTLLDDGRALAAWTVHQAGAPADKGWTVRARFLDLEGAPKGGEVHFEASRRHHDHDPALSAAKDGGFLMAWCSGIPSDPTHDVNVRLFDAQGKPAGPNLTPCFFANEQDFPDIARLADGSFAVAWEDDISFWDQVYVRRIGANGRSLGPLMRIATLDTEFVIDRVEPRITSFGDGFAAVFADRRRSLGFDVRLKIVGPRFDPPAGD